MILADTSIWIDYLRGNNTEMRRLLAGGQIVMHPFIVAEIALGSLSNRRHTFDLMESLMQVNVARLEEARHMIEAHNLYSKGLGLTDMHLIASCLITTGVQLWTRDAALDMVARTLGVSANL